jgi:hypothetical protein
MWHDFTVDQNRSDERHLASRFRGGMPETGDVSDGHGLVAPQRALARFHSQGTKAKQHKGILSTLANGK